MPGQRPGERFLYEIGTVDAAGRDHPGQREQPAVKALVVDVHSPLDRRAPHPVARVSENPARELLRDRAVAISGLPRYHADAEVPMADAVQELVRAASSRRAVSATKASSAPLTGTRRWS